MKKLNITVLVFMYFGTIIFAGAQTNPNADRDKVEKNTSSFSVNYFSKNENSFYVLTAYIKGRKIVINEKASIVEVAGNLPYEVGNFTVKVLDKQGEVLSSNTMQDPMIVRSCEEKSSEVKLLENGQVQIPIPKLKNIAILDLSRDKKRIQRLDITEVMKRYYKQRERN